MKHFTIEELTHSDTAIGHGIANNPGAVERKTCAVSPSACSTPQENASARQSTSTAATATAR